MSGVYWSLAGLSLIQTPQQVNDSMDRDAILDWVFSCFDESSGGFSGNTSHDPHLLYTLSALQILAILDALSDPRFSATIANDVASYISSLQLEDGSVMGDKWGEIDTRFSYCALSALSIIGRLHIDPPSGFSLTKACDYIASCVNFDGGFGCVPGAESHAGQIFCCVGALSIGNRLDLLDADLLSWWLAERQCDSGGLNGRPEKQVSERSEPRAKRAAGEVS